jgi:hypothetical protein
MRISSNSNGTGLGFDRNNVGQKAAMYFSCFAIVG